MIEYIYIPIILLLYLKTWKYNYLIDDFVPRGGYLYVLGDRPEDPNFYSKRRPILATVTNIGVFMATCFAIHHTFGWKVALLYAVSPLSTEGVCWITGNYYMTCTFFTLTAYFFALKGLIGTLMATPFFVAALGSTVSAIPFGFIWLITQNPIHLWFLVPLAFYIFGKRFQTGVRLRKEKHVDVYIKAGTFNWYVLYLMPKVVAYYIFLHLWPSRLGFWHDWHKNEAKKGVLGRKSFLFWSSLVLILGFFLFGYQVNKDGVLWFFLFIGLYSQFTTLGMMVAQRYVYLANVGFCMVASSFLTNDVAFAVLATLWFCKSWQYAKTFENNRTLMLESIDAHPGAIENYVNLSSWYLDRKRYVKAIEPLARACAVDDKNSGIHDNIAECYFRCGYFDKALYHVKEALKNCSQSRREVLLKWLHIIEARIETMQKNRKTLREMGVFKEQPEEIQW